MKGGLSAPALLLFKFLNIHIYLFFIYFFFVLPRRADESLFLATYKGAPKAFGNGAMIFGGSSPSTLMER
jgi:hypothetical protein